jgi:hypothetical protein
MRMGHRKDVREFSNIHQSMGEGGRERGGLSTVSVKPYGSVYNYTILILPPILYIGGI